MCQDRIAMFEEFTSKGSCDQAACNATDQSLQEIGVIALLMCRYGENIFSHQKYLQQKLVTCCQTSPYNRASISVMHGIVFYSKIIQCVLVNGTICSPSTTLFNSVLPCEMKMLATSALNASLCWLLTLSSRPVTLNWTLKQNNELKKR